MIARTRVETIGRCLPPESGKICTLFYNPPDAIAGILAALAAEFGVSERFATVRVSLYGLIKGGR